MTGSRSLAVDLGAESGRAVLAEFDGTRLTMKEVFRFENRPVWFRGTLYWDILRLIDGVGESLVLAAKASDGRLDSIGVDAWGVDFALLDRGGELVANPIHYRDRRTEGMLEEAFVRAPRDEIYACTGVQFMRLNTLFQLLSMVVHGDPRLESAESLLTIPDLFHYWLSGVRACEFTAATTTQCYDPLRGTWATDLLERLGIPTRLFGDIVVPGTVLGKLSSDLATRYGLGSVQVVTPASHDTASAVAAVPFKSGVHAAYISSGSWSLVGVEVDEPVITAESLAENLTNEGGVAGRFRLLRNVTGLWLLQECRRAWARDGHRWDYGDLVGMAEAARPFAGLIDPDDARFVEAGDMPAKVLSFLRDSGQSRIEEDPGAITRVILESLALKYRLVIGQLERATQRRIDAIHVVGGGSRNRLLSQLTADATGRPVIAGPMEATAVGNVAVQMMARGLLASVEEARDVVLRSFELDHYDPNSAHACGVAWDRFQGLLPEEGAS